MEGTGPGGKSRHLSPHWHFPAPPGGSQCVPRQGSVCTEVSSQRNLPGKSPEGGISIRCLHHLSRLLLAWRSSVSTPSSAQMTKLLPLSRRLSPATLRENPISAACSHYLILSVMIREGDPLKYSNFTLKYLLVFTWCLLALASSLLAKKILIFNINKVWLVLT